MTDRQRLIQAHQSAAEFYRQCLLGAVGIGPRSYLRDRTLDRFLQERRWVIGYAPPGWTTLLSHLDASGFTYSEIHTAGLAVATRRGTLIDRFRDRLMLGIRGHNGDLVGFIGRCPPAATSGPKYLNSPATDLFAKGRQLFGLAEQSDALRAGATPVVVEGPFDVLAVAGLQGPAEAHFAAVSACGTALRPAQAAILKEHSGSDVIVAYDADTAGHKAARTAYQRLSRTFDHVRVAAMPEEEDPASLGASNPAALLHSLRTTQPLADQLVDDVLRHYETQRDNAEARVCALHETTRLIAGFAPGDVSRQVTRVARRLDLPTTEVTRDLTDALSRNPSTAKRTAADIHNIHRTASMSARLSL